jgi:hypothetical protein
MLQILYLIAFTILAFLAIGNLIRSLVGFSIDAQRPGGLGERDPNRNYYNAGNVPHPELLDSMGNITDEPLLVVKSIGVEAARARLDALYHNSPSNSEET